MTSSTGALESIALQRDHHLRQKDIIRDRQTREEAYAEARRQRTAIVAAEDVDRPEISDAASRFNVYRTIEDCDTLLHFLNDRKTGTGNDHIDNRFIASYTVGIKVDKDDRTIIEELRVHNEMLQEQILQLLQEVEDERRKNRAEVDVLLADNRNLRQEVARLKGCSEATGNPWTSSEPFDAGLDLPPLEMPKFDFDVLNAERLISGNNDIK